MERFRNITIGRSSKCDYSIEDIEQNRTVSGNHATITETDTLGVFLFEDHSANGSYINGQFVHNESRTIKIDDHITLGKTYTISLTEIVKRYFPRKTTQKKNIPNSENSSQGSSLPHVPPIAPAPVVEKIEDPIPVTLKDLPMKFWVLYAASVIIAFILGCCMA